MKEIWKDIEGYECKYQISNNGDVKTILNKKIEILKKHKTKNGYYQVSLCKNGIRKVLYIHRLCAFAFVKNINNKKYINHINGKKIDNRHGNLEWCTQSENGLHAFKMGLSNPSENQKKMLRDRCSKKVLNLLNGTIYCSIKEASESLNISYQKLCSNLKNGKEINLKFIN
jgi:hypothetical protein